MPTTRNYGLAEIGQFEIADAIHLGPRETECIPTDEIAARIKSSLAAPLNYPTLAQATIPGDQIVIVVEPGTPQLVEVLDGVMQAFSEAGADARQITLLMSGTEDCVAEFEQRMVSRGHTSCNFKRHDPDNEKEIAFLGVSQEGLPLRLNRLLCDADFVLPVCTTRCALAAEAGTNYPLSPFPLFSDRETLDRLSGAGADEYPAQNQANAAEIDDCARQLGAQFGLQVVPHAHGDVAEVFAGESSTVQREAEAAFRLVWLQTAPRRANLVIATLTAAASEQSWHCLARAIAGVQNLLEPEAALVLLSELTAAPGQAICQLMSGEDPLVVEREILRTQSADCGPAMVLSRALQRGPVYLRSQLDAGVVESLGITPLENDSELERLTQTIRPCIVAECAQYLLPSVVEDEQDE